MSGYIQRRLRIDLTMRFSFPRISFVHNGVRTIEFPDERDTQRGGQTKQRAVRHVRRRKRCESTFRKESQATATQRNTWSRKSIGTTLGQGFWRLRNSIWTFSQKKVCFRPSQRYLIYSDRYAMHQGGKNEQKG